MRRAPTALLVAWAAALASSLAAGQMVDSTAPTLESTLTAAIDSSAAAAGPAATSATSYEYGFDADEDSDAQPDYWTRVTDKQHPRYVAGGLDFTVAQAGRASLKISAGGAPAEYLSPSVSIVGTSAYDVTAWIKTEALSSTGLRAASAYVEAKLFDAGDHLVASCRAFPEVTGTTDWTRVALVDVSRKYPQASSLRVATILDGVALEGCAWFDSIEIQRRPVAFFKTNRPGNVFHLSDKKMFSFEGRGLRAGTYELVATVRGIDGSKAHEATLAAVAGANGLASVQYVLPGLDAGPYTIDVDMSSGGVSVLKQSVHIGILPDYKGIENAPNFGLSLSAAPQEASAELELTADFGVGWTKLPLNAPEATAKAADLQVISELRRAGVTPVGVLTLPTAPTAAGAAQAAGGALLSRILAGPDAWTPALGDAINTFAGSVQWWQVGGDDDTALSQLGNSPEAYDGLKSFINGVCFQARLGLPAADVSNVSPAARKADFYSVGSSALLSAVTPPAGSPAPRGIHVWASADMADWVKGSPGEQASHAAADIAALFATGAEVVFLRDPWGRVGVLDNEGSVTPFALALDNMVRELSGCAYSGVFAFPNNTPNAMFASGANIKVLLWPSADPKEERMFLGDSLEVVDMYGRRSPATMIDGENSILVKDGPVFLEGLDPGTVETRKTFAIEPGVIDSMYDVQPVYVSFTNRFTAAIMGELTLGFPPAWQANPKLFFVRLKPGESFRGRANLVVPYNALAGLQDVSATLDLGGSQKTTILRRVELGSQAFKVEIETRASGADLTVYQKVTNVSDSPVEINAFLEGEGLERVEKLPRQLDKGASTTFSYLLADQASWQGRSLRASIRERQTNRFLNVEFTVPANSSGH